MRLPPPRHAHAHGGIVEFHGRVAAAVVSSQCRHARGIRVYCHECGVLGGVPARYGGAGSELVVLVVCVWALGVGCPWELWLVQGEALIGVGGNRYSTMDNIDGKQARRTGTSSPLGELFECVFLIQMCWEDMLWNVE